MKEKQPVIARWQKSLEQMIGKSPSVELQGEGLDVIINKSQFRSAFNDWTVEISHPDDSIIKKEIYFLKNDRGLVRSVFKYKVGSIGNIANIEMNGFYEDGSDLYLDHMEPEDAVKRIEFNIKVYNIMNTLERIYWTGDLVHRSIPQKEA